MAEAADAAPVILTHAPTACEGLDRRIVDVVARTRGTAAVPPLAPRRRLDVRRAGWRRSRVNCRRALNGCWSRRLHSTAGWSVTRRSPWPCGRSARTAPAWPGVSLSRPAYPGWEDAAVPPASLGAYLRDFDELLADHGLEGLPYGHFGDGCVHVADRLPADRARRRRPVPALRRGGGGAGGWLRRVDVWRTRRRPRPLGPAARDVLGIRPGPVCRRQGRLRPGQPAQPRRAGRSATRGRRSSRRRH